MDLEQIKTKIRQHPMIAYPLIVLTGVGLICFITASGKQTPPVAGQKTQATEGKNIGLSVGGIDQKAYLVRLEKNYYDFEDRVKAMEQEVKSMKSLADEIKNGQKDVTKTVAKLDGRLTTKMEDRLSEFQNQMETSNPMSTVSSQALDLSIADIQPVVRKDQDADTVYLPVGSFCKGTLLTGVYAASDANNPLPVLISLDEAFHGPDQTRIPLKGAFVLGKAYGDLVSERALIQIIAISSVLPNGHAFEEGADLGYVTDAQGELGIKGQVIRNTGRALALSFMGGFTAGGAQALANDEVTTHRTSDGYTTHDVTGDTGKNALFSGLAQSAGKMAEYYGQQAQNLVPAVHVKSGTQVCFIVQKGVKIDGLPRGPHIRVAHLD